MKIKIDVKTHLKRKKDKREKWKIEREKKTI